jgi:hypothetical protein
MPRTEGLESKTIERLGKQHGFLLMRHEGGFRRVPAKVLIPWKSGDELAKVKLKAEALMAAHIVNNAPKAGPADKTFRDLSPAVADALEQEAITTTYPTAAVLFAEGQAARGVFFVRRGRVKLSISGSDGRTLILRMVDAGSTIFVRSPQSVVGHHPEERAPDEEHRCHA